MRVPSSQTRPSVLRFIQWAVVLLGVWNLGRVVALWRQLRWLEELPLTFEPRFRLMFALIWGILFLASAVALRIGQPRSRQVLPLLIIAYGVYEIGMIAIFSLEKPALLPVLLYSLFALWIAWAMYRPTTKAYFDSIQMRR